MKCVCGKDAGFEYEDHRIRGGSLAKIAECRFCGTQQLVKKTRPEYYVDQYRQDVPKKPGYYQFFHDDYINKTVLDFGSDDGEYLANIDAHIKIAIDLHPPRRRLLLWSDSLLAVPANFVDLMTCWVTVEHLLNPSEWIVGAYALLKEGGRLVFTTPSLELAPEERSEWYRPHHNWYFSKRGLIGLCNSFSSIGISHPPYPFDDLWKTVCVK